MRGDWIGLKRISVALIALASAWGGPAEAQRLLADGVRDLADQIAAKAKEQQKLRVAVLPFRELEGQPTVLGTFLAEELFTHLVNSGLEIIERSMLDRVLGEIKLDQTGLIDAATAKQMGKVIGVDAVVTGSITDLQSYVAINCRLIDATSGKIFAAAQTKIVKDDDVKKIMAAVPAGSRPASQRQGGSSAVETTGAATKPREVGDFVRVEEEIRFEVSGCVVSGTAATCDILITNQGGDRRLSLDNDGTRLFDVAGNEALATQVTLGKASTSYGVQSLLVSGVMIRGRVRFEPVDAEAREAALVELNCYADKRFRVQFRNVPLARR